MAINSKIYELKCPTCGAPLPQSGRRITCDYCGSVLEREYPPVETPMTASTTPEPQVVIIQRGYSPGPYSQRSGGGTCLFRLLTLVLIVGVVGFLGWFQFPAQTSSLLEQLGLADDLTTLTQLPQQLANKASVTAVNRIVLAPSGNDTGSDFMTFAYQTDASTYALTYVNTADSTIRWQSPPLKEWFNTRVLQAADMIYVTDETKLYAFNREDGQIIWQTSLADKLANSCQTCFELVENRLIALVEGGTVQGFDAESGQLIWSERLNFESTARLLIADDDLLIFDRAEDTPQNLLRVINPVTGESRGTITLSTCAGEFVNFNQIRLYHPNRAELYLINAGNAAAPPCLQIWDVANQTMTQEIPFSGLSLPIDTSWVSRQAQTVLADERLYITAEDKVGGETGLIIEFNLVDGQWRVVAEALDYSLNPLAVTEDTLIVQATRSRGTERHEMWGINLASGETGWQHILEASRWSQERGSGDVWDWHLTSTGVVILQVLSDPDQVMVEVLNPQTGVSDGQKIIPVSDSFFSELVWSNDTAWVVLRQIHKIDLNNGTLTYIWP